MQSSKVPDPPLASTDTMLMVHHLPTSLQSLPLTTNRPVTTNGLRKIYLHASYPRYGNRYLPVFTCHECKSHFDITDGRSARMVGQVNIVFINAYLDSIASISVSERFDEGHYV
jgi:hypothetical protein